MAFARIGDQLLHYRISGPDGAPFLVLAHALGTDCGVWDPILPLLSSHYQVLCYDLRGHGLSDAPAGPYSIDQHVADLAGLSDRLGIGRFALVGLSIGGLIAQHFAATHPQRLAALCLVGSAPKMGTAEFWDERIRMVETKGLATISEAVVSRWFSTAFKAGFGDDFSGWRHLLERTSAIGYVGACATLRDSDLGAETEKITAPTLLVVGEEDPTVPPPQARQFAEALPNAELLVIEGAGHFPNVERPVVVTDALKRFLSEVGFV